MVEHPPPVAEHGGIVGHGSKGQQYRAALPLFGRKKLPPVAGHPLVFVLVAIVVGQRFDRVGQAHRLQLHPGAFGADDGGIKGGGKQPAVVPIVVFHSLSPSLCTKKVLTLMLPQSCERKKHSLLIFPFFVRKMLLKSKRPRRAGGSGKELADEIGHGAAGIFGVVMPFALPSSMHLSSQAMFRPSSRITAQPSVSSSTCSGLEPCTMGQ